MMGSTDLPYHACQVVMWAKIIAFGDRNGIKNNFRWKKVVVRLPGTTAYDCQLPWVYKEWRYRVVAYNCYVYVDDERPIRTTKILCWKVSRH